MNNTAEQGLALQKGLPALLIHHVDWRDQFTFVHSLASPSCMFQGGALWQKLQADYLTTMPGVKSTDLHC